MIYSSSITSNTVISRLVNTITSDCMVYDPNTQYIFSQASDPESTSYFQQCREAKLTHKCDHNVQNVQYGLSVCPRCLGSGYYYDIKIDGNGLILQISGSDKLVQELEKMIKTTLLDNRFHHEYGFPDISGYVSTTEQIAYIKQSIIDMISDLKSYQEEHTRKNVNNFSADELINKVESVEIVQDPTDPQRITYVVTVNTLSSQQPIIITGSI